MRKLIVWSAVVLLAASGTAVAAPTYSIDYQGPMAIGNGGPVSEGDILTRVPPGSPPPPAVVIPVGALGVIPGVTGMQEVDALSYGRDYQVTPDALVPWLFSVDEFAVGFPGNVGKMVPSVWFEGASGPNGVGPGIGEASADVFLATPPMPGPFPPVFPWPNDQVYDGDGIPDIAGMGLPGMPVCSQPGLNLLEPNPPTPMVAPPPPANADPGDNLDALDVNTSANDLAGPVYFSLDSYFPDPLEAAAPPPNTGTAVGQGMGFVGGDVLVSMPGAGPPALYAAAPQLGLDQVGGPDSDDLDALVLWDNGNGVYDPVLGPYTWLAGTDMLLFSVRRGSALIGMPDSLWGAPIEEGDILIPMGPGILPGIFIPAESLGLATVRSGTWVMWGAPNPAYGMADMWADDLDALDVVPEPGGLALLGLALLAQRRRRRVA